jgi:hypothetical protein
MSLFSPAFALVRPWGLWTPTSRVELNVGIRNDIETTGGLWIVAAKGLQVTFSGRRTIKAEMEGGEFEWNGRKQLWSIPIGSKKGEEDFSLVLHQSDFGSPAIHFAVRIVGLSPRPREPSTDTSSGRTLKLLLELAERLRTLVSAENREIEMHVLGRKVVGGIVPWQIAADIWCRDVSEIKNPPLDIIVRHSEQNYRLVDELAMKPRRILKRVRERLPVNRLQEMDPACLEWFVRQPGVTVAEKSGSRQSLLGVARHENFDTLENKVLVGYIELAALAASSYTSLHQSMKQSERYRLVARYGRLCRILARDLIDLGISRPTLPIMPNYVLQHDQRYQKVWKGFLELLRRSEEEDDVWRWQIRLWSEFCRLSIIMALRQIPETSIFAETPLLIRTDQERGRWADTSWFATVLRVPIDCTEYVVTVLDPQDIRARSFGPEDLWPHIWSVNPTCILHSQSLETKTSCWTLVWSSHSILGQPISAVNDVRSANAALEELQNTLRRFGGNQITLRGIVLISDTSIEPKLADADFGNVLAYVCPIDGENLSGTISHLTEMLPLTIFGA